ncbi:hypothetical protein C8Q73DRAFT_652861 [Cubamyces lactineus]|nr:hypothetical protein C8Q73DRAFT_652861 [Cubamyces lactineus]
MNATYPDKPSPFPRPQDVPSTSAGFSRTPWLSSPRRNAANLSIPHLREALHSLESKMATLLSERDLLESRLEQAVRLQSPVQRVPNDLLSSIFSIAVLDGEEEDSITLSNLMLVCRYWREVAIHTPMLWTRIVMGTHRSVDRALLKLDRSRSAPLYICLDFSPRMEHGTVSTESIVTAMDLIRPAIWRWKTFHLTVPSRPQAHVALTRCREQAPLLEVLSIRVAHSMQEDHYSTPPLPLFERHTPRLRSSSFTSFNFGWDIALLSNLRVLKLGGYWNGFSPSVDVILKTLRACPQLEELVLRNMSDVDPESCASLISESSEQQDDFALARVSDTRTIQLPRLRKASFYYSGNLRTRTVFSLLSFPALERIELCYLDNVSPILECLRKQSLTVLPLRHLRIESCFLNELRFARLLQRLPALNSLELVDVEDVTSNLMRNFAAPPVSQTWVCPKLATLSLEGCTSIEWETIRSIVESRLPPHSRAFPRQTARQASPSPARPAVSSASVSSASGQRPAVSSSTSSASAFAATAHILSHQPATSSASHAVGRPVRIESMDLTRCHQISKEMVQWLRMYVAEVKCETVKSVWGEPSLS